MKIKDLRKRLTKLMATFPAAGDSEVFIVTHNGESWSDPIPCNGITAPAVNLDPMKMSDSLAQIIYGNIKL